MALDLLENELHGIGICPLRPVVGICLLRHGLVNGSWLARGYRDVASACLLEKMIRQPRTALGIAKRRGDAQDFQLRRPEGQGNGKRIVNVVPDICIYDGLLRAEPAGGKEEKGNDAQQGSPDHETSLLRVADLPEAAILALHDVMARRRGIVFASQHRAVQQDRGPERHLGVIVLHLWLRVSSCSPSA
jgi:hypothetical protein